MDRCRFFRGCRHLLWAAAVLAALAAGPAGAQDYTSVAVSVPDYSVNTVGGLDYVDIPGGETMLGEEGRPAVPYFVKSLDLPQDCRVQAVTLQARSGLKTARGLRLPVVVHQEYPTAPVAMKGGWYPQADYEWEALINADGSTSLVISVYPFYYNPDTAEVNFYQYYEFSVAYVVSAVRIARISPSAVAYATGSRAVFNLLLENTGAAQDVVVGLVIKRPDTEEPVESLPLSLLRSLQGEASFAASWEVGDTAAGDYLLEATVYDTAGTVLDRGTHVISVQPGKPTTTNSFYYLLAGGAAVVGLGVLLVAIRSLKSRRRR